MLKCIIFTPRFTPGLSTPPVHPPTGSPTCMMVALRPACRSLKKFLKEWTVEGGENPHHQNQVEIEVFFFWEIVATKQVSPEICGLW